LRKLVAGYAAALRVLTHVRALNPSVPVIVRARDEAVQHRIVEHLPPLAALLRHGRRGNGPVLLELRRRFGQLLRLDLRQRSRATSEQRHYHQKRGQDPFSVNGAGYRHD